MTAEQDEPLIVIGYEHLIEKLRYFDLATAFSAEANRMLAASKLKSALNEVKNISSGGREVERSILDYLRRNFVDSYPIHQGHVIDRSSRISPQIDVVITWHNSLPLFCSTLDGTTIVMREAVLALGEIKSSYYKAGLANKFTNCCGAVTEMDKGEGKRDLFF